MICKRSTVFSNFYEKIIPVSLSEISSSKFIDKIVPTKDRELVYGKYYVKCDLYRKNQTERMCFAWIWEIEIRQNMSLFIPQYFDINQSLSINY